MVGSAGRNCSAAAEEGVDYSWMSDAVTNPSDAVDAYVNLDNDTTTVRNPRLPRAYSVCVLSVTTIRM